MGLTPRDRYIADGFIKAGNGDAASRYISCDRKMRYPNMESAFVIALKNAPKDSSSKQKPIVYFCRHCAGFHMGHRERRKQDVINDQAKEIRRLRIEALNAINRVAQLESSVSTRKSWLKTYCNKWWNARVFTRFGWLLLPELDRSVAGEKG